MTLNKLLAKVQVLESSEAQAKGMEESAVKSAGLKEDTFTVSLSCAWKIQSQHLSKWQTSHEHHLCASRCTWFSSELLNS